MKGDWELPHLEQETGGNAEGELHFLSTYQKPLDVEVGIAPVAGTMALESNCLGYSPGHCFWPSLLSVFLCLSKDSTDSQLKLTAEQNLLLLSPQLPPLHVAWSRQPGHQPPFGHLLCNTKESQSFPECPHERSEWIQPPE